MRTSMTATSGWSSRILSSAARPSAASATSSRSERSAITRAMASRKSGWSSAMRTLVVRLPPIGASVPALRGHGELEDAASAGALFDPDPAAMALDDALADRKAHARPRVLVLAVEPLEHVEDPLSLVRIDADAVVAHRDDALAVDTLGADRDNRRLLAMELDRVADQVSEKSLELGRAPLHDRQLAFDLYAGSCLLDPRGERPERRIDDLGELDAGRILGPRLKPRVVEQVVDHRLHPRGLVADVAQERPALLVERVAMALAEHPCIRRQQDQRLLQVVRRDVRELIELGIGALQVLLRLCELGLRHLAIGDVEHVREGDARRILLTQERNGEPDPDPVPVLVAVPLLDPERIAAAGSEFLEQDPLVLRVIGMGQIALREFGELGGRVPEQTRHLGVDLAKPAVFAPLEVDDGDPYGDAVEPLLRVPERPLGLGEVAGLCRDTHDLAVGPVNR